MKNRKQPSLLVMAGGTGGHVFPGLAVARELADRGWQINWLGTRERMEAELVPKHGFNIHFIDVKGVRGNGIKRLIAMPLMLFKAIRQALRIMRQLKPSVVIGMGGYASGPGGIAAWLTHRPLVLHEQNAVTGLTNRYLGKIATRTLMAFPGTFNRADAQVVGNPVRRELVAVPVPEQRFAQRAHEGLRVLVIGGSLGARVLNDTVPAAIAGLAEQGHSVEVWHQSGKGNGQSVADYYRQLGLEPFAAADFIDDMAAAYQWADVVICRAGALTVSELAAVGLGSILVPLPHAVDDHQTVNARVLVDADAGYLLPQAQLTPERLIEYLQPLAIESQRCLELAKNARQVAITDAALRVADICCELIAGQEVK